MPTASSRCPAAELAALACLGVVQFAFAHFFFFRSIEHIPVQEASLICLVEPVLNPLWVALWVGELPSLATFIGGGMILGGLGLRYVPFGPSNTSSRT